MSEQVGEVADETTESARRSESGPDIRWWERVGSALLGGALLIRGLRRRSLGGTVMALVGGALSYRALSGRSRLYRAFGVDTASDRERRESEASTEAQTVARSVTIGRPADELSERLRDPETLERITGHFAEVTSAGEDRHRWTVSAPFGRSLTWETRLVEQDDGEGLRWEPVEGGALVDEWSMSFRQAPGDRGTQVTLEARFDPPGGRFGSAVMEALDAAPETLVGTALDRFKSLAETGTVPTLERNPSARGKGDLL